MVENAVENATAWPCRTWVILPYHPVGFLCDVHQRLTLPLMMEQRTGQVRNSQASAKEASLEQFASTHTLGVGAWNNSKDEEIIKLLFDCDGS